MRVNPTTTAAKSTSRLAMPPSAMMAPASTKNGMVSIETLPDAAGKLLHDRADRQVDPERADERRQRQRIGDRHADREEEAHAEKQNGDIHGNYSTGTWASAPSRGGGPMVRRSTTNRSIMAPLTTIGR